MLIWGWLMSRGGGGLVGVGDVIGDIIGLIVSIIGVIVDFFGIIVNILRGLLGLIGITANPEVPPCPARCHRPSS